MFFLNKSRKSRLKKKKEKNTKSSNWETNQPELMGFKSRQVVQVGQMQL